MPTISYNRTFITDELVHFEDHSHLKSDLIMIETVEDVFIIYWDGVFGCFIIDFLNDSFLVLMSHFQTSMSHFLFLEMPGSRCPDRDAQIEMPRSR